MHRDLSSTFIEVVGLLYHVDMQAKLDHICITDNGYISVWGRLLRLGMEGKNASLRSLQGVTLEASEATRYSFVGQPVKNPVQTILRLINCECRIKVVRCL